MATKEEILEIKSKANIVDIVSEYIALKKSGSVFFGLCPFHSEKSPSFAVNENLGIFKCFGCQEGGDIITFLQKIEGISFPEACEILSIRLNIPLTLGSKDSLNQSNEMSKILKINTLSKDVFVYILKHKDFGKEAREYLRKRNISMEIVDLFNIGFDSDNLISKVLQKHNYTIEETIKFGLSVQREGKIVDKFRGRIVFPIFSITGDVVGFSGRRISSNTKSPKYINSPENAIFKKGNIFYGTYQAKSFIRKMNEVIIVEGHFDMISAFSFGLKNTIALQGTSLTKGHLEQLSRITNNIIFCFDSDEAGFKALLRSTLMAIDNSFNTKVINLGKYKDLDELINSVEFKGSKIDIQSLVRDSIEYIIDMKVIEFGNLKSSNKDNFLDFIISLIKHIQDLSMQSSYITYLSHKLNINEKIIFEKAKIPYSDSSITSPISGNTLNKKFKNKPSREAYIFTIFLNNFESLSDIIDEFDMRLLFNPGLIRIGNLLKNASQNKNTILEFLDTLSKQERTICIALMTKAKYQNITGDIEKIRSEVSKLTNLLEKKKIHEELKSLRNKLFESEVNNDDNLQLQILGEIREKSTHILELEKLSN